MYIVHIIDISIFLECIIELLKKHVKCLRYTCTKFTYYERGETSYIAKHKYLLHSPFNPYSFGGGKNHHFRFFFKWSCSHNNNTASIKHISLFDTSLVMTSFNLIFFFLPIRRKKQETWWKLPPPNTIRVKRKTLDFQAWLKGGAKLRSDLAIKLTYIYIYIAYK